MAEDLYLPYNICNHFIYAFICVFNVATLGYVNKCFNINMAEIQQSSRNKDNSPGETQDKLLSLFVHR